MKNKYISYFLIKKIVKIISSQTSTDEPRVVTQSSTEEFRMATQLSSDELSKISEAACHPQKKVKGRKIMI